MPKGSVNESKWDEAKASVRKQYKFSEENPRFWKLVNAVYKKMGGKFSKKTEKSLADLISACEELEKATPQYVVDKSLWVKIEREDVIGSGLSKSEQLGKTLQMVNYLCAGGRLNLVKNVDPVSPEAILKSNIAQQFGEVKTLPEIFVGMLKSLPGEIKYPHRYMTRVKDENTGRWRYLYKKQVAKKPEEEEKPKEAIKKESAPTKEAEKPTEKPQTKKVKSSKHIKQRAKMKIAAVETAKHEPKKVQKSEDDILAERIEKGDLKLNQQDTILPESNLDKGMADSHAKEEAQASEHYKKMSKEEKDPKEKKALKEMAGDEKKHSEHFKEKVEEKKTEKSQAVNIDSQWVESRMKGVERDLKSQYPDMGDAEASTQARECLENMYKAGLR